MNAKTADLCWVYMTTSSQEEARQIGRALVEEHLAACTNIISPMTSFYWWKGTLEEGKEAVLLAKTSQARLAALTERVKALHSYECPCVVALPILGGNVDYLSWLASESGESGETGE